MENLKFVFNNGVMTIEQLNDWVSELSNGGINEVQFNGTVELTVSHFDKETIGRTDLIK
ncbi:hypothetical protein [Paenibacillus sp. O199]|uniref:hypothetical protein n=1 Tax=Paenibacillus sp. O199 TaxID=1643925 RepID=UPI000B257296|nr:hypothetical protein [Paenibacillus sp. O199]